MDVMYTFSPKLFNMYLKYRFHKLFSAVYHICLISYKARKLSKSERDSVSKHPTPSTKPNNAPEKTKISTYTDNTE